jgi:SNF2 family DNA or RNA helicase
MRTRDNLRGYQKAAIEFIKRVKRGAFFFEPGLGKTGTTLTAIADMIENLDCGMTLVVAPPHVSKKTWPDELKQWAHTRDLSYVVIKGSVKQREKLLKRKACFHMISVELLPWLVEALGGQRPVRDKLAEDGTVLIKGKDGWRPPKRIPYDAIILDESTKLKQYNTNRWKAMKQIAFQAEYFVALTGTPSPNGMEDLWAQIYLLDRGERLGHNITAFRERWFNQSFDGHGYQIKGDYVIKTIEDRIADIVFTLREKDYADLPPKMFNTVTLEMDDKVKETYKQFERTYILQVSDIKNIRALDGASISTKLQQLANGVVYDEEKVGHAFHDLKLQALGSIVDELGGAPVLVAYAFKTDAERILKKFPQAKLFDGKDSTQDAWNRGEIPMLLAHPQSVAHGLNLQKGGCNAVWYGLTWSLELYLQFNKRLHRSGQTKPVMIHHLLVEGTIDEDVLSALQDKDKAQESLLEALKKRIEMYK